MSNNKESTNSIYNFNRNVQDAERAYRENLERKSSGNGNKYGIAGLNEALTVSDFSDRSGISKLHAEDIISKPIKTAAYMGYEYATNGTYMNKGIDVAASVYMPMVKLAASAALQSLSKGAVQNFLNSSCYNELKKTLVFDAEKASGDIRSLLSGAGVNERNIENIINTINKPSFDPSMNMAQIYDQLNLKNVINPDTNKPFTSSEIKDLRRNIQQTINLHTPNMPGGIDPSVFMDFSPKGLQEQEKMINKFLSEHKLAGTKGQGIGNLAGTASPRKLKKLLKRKDLTPLERALAKYALKLQAAMKTQNMACKSKKLGVVRNVMRKAKSSLKDQYMMSGMFLMLDVGKTVLKTLKYTLKTLAKLGKGLKFGLKIIARPARALHHLARRIPVVNTAATKFIDPVVRFGRAGYNAVHEKVDAGKKLINSHTQRRNARKAKIRKFIRDPFNIRGRIMNRLANSAAGKLVGKATAPFRNAANMVKDVITKLLSLIMRVVSVILSIISVILIVLLIVVIIMLICAYIISAVANMFTANSDADSDGSGILEECIETINTMYEEQMDDIDDVINSGKYRNVTVNMSQVKDDEAYEANDTEVEGGDISAYTNSREIISMAKVYFDFDLEDENENEVLNYVKRLFNGSHKYALYETPYYDVDEEGKKYIAGYDATINYTTYYFNSIFSCELANDSYVGSANLGTDLSGNTYSEQMWNYFKSAGWTDEACAAAIGNAAQECGGTLISGITPNCDNGNALGVFQFTGSLRKQYLTWAKNNGYQWDDLEAQLAFFCVSASSNNPDKWWLYDQSLGLWFRAAGYNAKKCTYEEFTQMTDIEEATMGFLCGYEKCKYEDAHADVRIREAKKAYELYKTE